MNSGVARLVSLYRYSGGNQGDASPYVLRGVLLTRQPLSSQLQEKRGVRQSLTSCRLHNQRKGGRLLARRPSRLPPESCSSNCRLLTAPRRPVRAGTSWYTKGRQEEKALAEAMRKGPPKQSPAVVPTSKVSKSQPSSSGGHARTWHFLVQLKPAEMPQN